MIDWFWFLSLAHVPSANMEGAEFMSYTGASHQGAIKMIWLHFWGAVMSSIFIYSLCFKPLVAGLIIYCRIWGGSHLIMSKSHICLSNCNGIGVRRQHTTAVYGASKHLHPLFSLQARILTAGWQLSTSRVSPLSYFPASMCINSLEEQQF